MFSMLFYKILVISSDLLININSYNIYNDIYI